MLAQVIVDYKKLVKKEDRQGFSAGRPGSAQARRGRCLQILEESPGYHL